MNEWKAENGISLNDWSIIPFVQKETMTMWTDNNEDCE